MSQMQCPRCMSIRTTLPVTQIEPRVCAIITITVYKNEISMQEMYTTNEAETKHRKSVPCLSREISH